MKFVEPCRKTRLRSSPTILKRQTQSELNLPRIKHCSRRAVTGIWRSLPECAGSANRNKIGRGVDRIVKTYVHGVERIEAFRERLERKTLRQLESTGYSQIHALEAVSLERVPWLDTRSVVRGEPISVGVETGKLREVVRRLEAEDR